ncbi:hypothetical protein W02_42830 [Nitrospira sp. KM1]|uniref:hypothetical protein n=1 Tax=Nitrospira sp. KM1 TaxID=1936990 RepID=UPI0013A75D06|nr:hypothetical protein [Nitrospira sp. KM1]BCA57143.1 hypothetical protein W02_42830 [Nitrospira sp. KM1]
MTLEAGSNKEKAAAIARDVTVAAASALDKSALMQSEAGDLYTSNLVKLYEAIHAAALKSITG